MENVSSEYSSYIVKMKVKVCYTARCDLSGLVVLATPRFV